jgi:hypothetical protein
LEAFLLSHIKAPAQGGKAGSGKPPTANLTKRVRIFKVATARQARYFMRETNVLRH